MLPFFFVWTGCLCIFLFSLLIRLHYSPFKTLLICGAFLLGFILEHHPTVGQDVFAGMPLASSFIQDLAAWKYVFVWCQSRGLCSVSLIAWREKPRWTGRRRAQLCRLLNKLSWWKGKIIYAKRCLPLDLAAHSHPQTRNFGNAQRICWCRAPRVLRAAVQVGQDATYPAFWCGSCCVANLPRQSAWLFPSPQGQGCMIYHF